MFVDHPLVRKDKVSLRRYQESVLVRALEENTLVVLPTGLGKTMVAAMVAAERLRSHPQGRVLFLAPTKPLVVQHMRSFADLLIVEDMCILTGAESPENRKGLWSASRIIFATPQTIENDIIRGLDLTDVSLIVFDEAHRAVGDYSYVMIASEYLKKAAHPLVLALTASPSSEREKVEEICANLGIRHVEAKTDQDADVRPYIQDVKVRWVQVELAAPFRQIQKLLQDVLREDVRKLKELGYMQSADIGKVNKRAMLALQSEIRGDISSGVDSYLAASLAASALKVDHALELLETQGIVGLDEYFARLRAQGTKAVKRLMRNHDMTLAMTLTAKLRKEKVEHPKIAEIVRIVGKYKGKKVLVFTQYRDSVDMIIKSLNDADILAHEFIGQARKGLKTGMTQKRQVDVLEKFSEGAYTALVATSVAKEGLDIPAVDAVVFYEPVPSEIRAIQRRGRTGRSAAGEVYVLMAKGTRDEGYYWSSVHKERKMGDVIRGMRKGLVNQKNIAEYDESQEPATVGDGVEIVGGSDVIGPESMKKEASGEYRAGQQSIASFGAVSGKLKIIVDAREKSGAIMAFLRERCDIELRNLPEGDYLLSDRVCVERKTVQDFLQSIIDKRLMGQMTDLRRNFQIPVLIIEGTDSLYSLRNIHPNAVRGTLASLAVDFDVPVIPSESEEDTANILYAMARREQEDNRRPVSLRTDRKPQLLYEKQRFIVESLPNVSAVLAERLLNRFGSVERVFQASQEELEEVEGIGSKKAQEIIKVVKNRYAK